MSSQAVAIVALGVINPAACGIQAFEASLRAGTRRIGRIEARLAPRGKALLGTVDGPSLPARLRAFHLARVATEEALAQWDPRDRVDAGQIGYFLSTIGGESAEVEAYRLAGDHLANRRMRRKAAYGSVPNGRLHFKLARSFGLYGPQIAISNTCASGNVSMGIALDLIREGACKAAVISAVELCTLGTLWGADRAAILGTRLAPFDAARDGAIFGEGAATVILADSAIIDPRDVLGWVCGFGSSCDAENAAIAFEADGAGLYRAMSAALKDGTAEPVSLDYVNAHAPGTPVIDKLECKAVVDLLGGAHHAIAINSTKSITTHLAGAGSITELAATVVQMQGDFVHANVGLETVASDMMLEPVGDQAMSKPVRTALSNALGGGGLYTSVLLRRSDWTPPAGASDASAGRGSSANVGEAPDEEASDIVVVAHSGWRGSAEPIGLTQRFPALAPFAPMNRAAQLALAASNEIFAMSAAIPRDRSTGQTPGLGVFSATFLGGLPESLHLFLGLLAEQPKAIKPSTVLEHGVNLGGALIGRHHGLTGPNYSFVGSRVSSVQALASGLSHLRAGRIQAALVTGFDAVQGLEEAQVHGVFEGTVRMVDASAGLLLKTRASLHRDERSLGRLASAAVVRLEGWLADPRPGLTRLLQQLHHPSGLRTVRICNHGPLSNDRLVQACQESFGDARILLEDTTGADLLAAGPLLLVGDALRQGSRTLILLLDEYLQLAGIVVDGQTEDGAAVIPEGAAC